MVGIKFETMAKRLTKQEKYEKAIKDIIDHMFAIAGHDITYNQVKDRKDDWYTQWTMTVDQNEVWKVWGIQYLQKTFRWNKEICKKEMSWIALMWGLKFSDFEHKIVQ